MEVKYLSATAIKDFLQCPQKFLFRVEKDVPRMSNDSARLGIAVHEALEQFVKRMASKKSFPDPSDYDFVLTAFMNKATEEGLESMDFYTDGRQMLVAVVDAHDPGEEIIDVEHRFRLETADGIPITGAIDKVIKIDEDTLGIVDYKTSKSVLTPRELHTDVQLSMYDLAASILWPQYSKRVLILDYVRLGKQLHTQRSPEEQNEFRSFLQSVWLQISKLEEYEVKGKLNRLCGWCDYRDYCPAYTQLMKTKRPLLPPLAELDDYQFLEHWEQISDMKSILEARQRELKMMANEKMHRGEMIRAHGKELYALQQSRTNYEISDVADLIPSDELLPLLTVHKGRLDSYTKDDAELRRKLATRGSVSYNAPSFRTREVEIDTQEAPSAEPDASAA